MNEFKHLSVLERELVDCLGLESGHTAVDCTAGYGGHTAGLLARVGNKGRVFAFDQDRTAIECLEQRFFGVPNLKIFKLKFSQIGNIFDKYAIKGQINGICADIGASSLQLDDPDRGFSFMRDGPLSMKMDFDSEGRSAFDIVNEASEEELTDIFRRFGQEPKARFVARAIVVNRKNGKIATTGALAEIVRAAVHYPKRSKKHPATKVFQALRIAVNDELGQLSSLIDLGFEALCPGGRMGVISFHSLEDQIVKSRFKSLGGKSGPLSELPREIPLTQEDVGRLCGQARGRIIAPFPILPSSEEVQRNPRARSARLRVIEKL